MITYNYNRELDILEVQYNDTLLVQEYVDFIENIRIDKSLPRRLRILTDAREAFYDFSSTDIQKISDALLACVNNYSCVMMAVIHAKPNETAISMIFKHRNRIPALKHEIFITPEAALRWLSAWK